MRLQESGSYQHTLSVCPEYYCYIHTQTRMLIFQGFSLCNELNVANVKNILSGSMWRHFSGQQCMCKKALVLSRKAETRVRYDQMNNCLKEYTFFVWSISQFKWEKLNERKSFLWNHVFVLNLNPFKVEMYWWRNMCWSLNFWSCSSSLVSVMSAGFPGQHNTRLPPKIGHL